MPLGLSWRNCKNSGKVCQVQSTPARWASAGDVLDRLQRAHQQVLVVGVTGREREPAVAHDHAGHAVVAGGGAVGIPGDLRVEVGVSVDEAGRDDQTVGIELFLALLGDASNRGDAVAGDADVGLIAGSAGAVDDGSAANHEVVGHGVVAFVCVRGVAHANQSGAFKRI